MKQYITGLLFLSLFFIVGCSQLEESSGSPPAAFVHAGEQTEEMVLGTYSWDGRIVDAVGPVDLLEDKNPIIVKPKETVTFSVDSEVEPNSTSLEVIDGEIIKEISLDGDSFTAPAEEGIYYYSFGALWEEKDAFYAFALEVVE